MRWAQERPLKNKNQRDLLVFIAEQSGEAGEACLTKAQMIAGCADIGTVGQADRALRGLMDGGLVSARWNMDRYVHIYTPVGPR